MDEYDRRRMRELFVAQLRRMSFKTKVTINPKTGEPRVKKSVTGKLGKEKDDAYMSLTIGLMGAVVWYQGMNEHA